MSALNTARRYILPRKYLESESVCGE
jgi:hypothetical protein